MPLVTSHSKHSSSDIDPRLRRLRRIGRLINRVRTILKLRKTILKVSRSVTESRPKDRFILRKWLIHFTSEVNGKILKLPLENSLDFCFLFWGKFFFALSQEDLKRVLS